LAADDDQRLDLAILMDDVDRAGIGDERHRQPRHASQARFVVQRRCQQGRGLAEEALRRLGLFALADVADAGDRQPPVAQAHLADRQLDRESGAVASAADDLQVRADHERLAGVPEQQPQVPADHVGGRVAEQALGRRVEGVDLAAPVLGIERDDRVGDAVHHGADAGFALLGQLGHGVGAAGGVLELRHQHAQVADHAPEGGAQAVARRFGAHVLAQVATRHGVGYAGHVPLVRDHLLEGLAQFAHLVAGADLDLLVEVADGQALGRLGQLAGRAGDAAGDVHADDQAEQHSGGRRQDGNPPRHLVRGFGRGLEIAAHLALLLEEGVDRLVDLPGQLLAL
jgi:hypothetical protein